MSLFNSFCAYLDLEIRRKGTVVCQRYENGRLVNFCETVNDSDRSGNTIRFKFSDQKLKERIDVEEITEYLASVSAIHDTLDITVNGRNV